MGITSGLAGAYMHGIGAAERIPQAVVSATPATDALLATGVKGGIAPDIHAGRVSTESYGFDMRGDKALQTSIRDSISNTMAPLLDDWHRALRELDDAPVASWPRAGSDPVVQPIRAGWDDIEKYVVADHATQGHKAAEFATSTMPNRLLEDYIQIPVGDYGPDFAKTLAEAARVMGGALDGDLHTAAKQVTEQSGSMFGNVTFQSTASRALMEAANTVAGTTAILTNKRIEGLEPKELIAALRKGRVFERAAAAPEAIWGPMVFRGGWMPNNPLEVSKEGVAAMTPELTGMLQATKAARAVSAKPVEGIETTLGCPFLARKAALLEAEEAAGEVSRNYIRRFADDYLKIIERLLDDHAATKAG